jgi:toxin ParE1/3/4
MPLYKIRIEERALVDIQQAFDYYEAKQAGLGVRFNQSVFHSFEILRQNPFYQVRYDTFRCLPVKKFPYMIHYEVEEAQEVIHVFAVINTHLDPDKNWLDV